MLYGTQKGIMLAEELVAVWERHREREEEDAGCIVFKRALCLQRSGCRVGRAKEEEGEEEAGGQTRLVGMAWRGVATRGVGRAPLRMECPGSAHL